ncbi:hypothetical protein ACSQ67_001664 [Phaseolus vulgaris]
MEFWGVEVKSGQSLKVDPGDDKIIHLSNACLGDVTKAKGGELVALNVKFDFDEDIPVSAANGKHEFKVKNGVKLDEAKQKKIADPRKNEKAKEKDTNVEDEDSSESDDDDDSSEDKVSIEEGNKRKIESSKKTPVPEKKAKFVTPQKTDSKNVVHIATPHPSKQAGKSTANNKRETPKSGGDYSCKPCSRSFKTEDALNSHNRAKHSAK